MTLTITGSASTDLLLRLINLVAQRGYLLLSLEAGIRDDTLVVSISLEAPAGNAVETMIEKMAGLVDVKCLAVDMA